MKIEFDKSFDKSLDKIGDKSIFPSIEKLILNCEKAKSIREIPHLKKMVGYDNYYRVRLGNYRIGIEIFNKDVIRFVIVAHRKDIYKIFPK